MQARAGPLIAAAALCCAVLGFTAGYAANTPSSPETTAVALDDGQLNCPREMLMELRFECRHADWPEFTAILRDENQPRPSGGDRLAEMLSAFDRCEIEHVGESPPLIDDRLRVDDCRRLEPIAAAANGIRGARDWISTV